MQLLKLLIPALIPSWNFFDVIAPSPRVQFALLSSGSEEPRIWYDFRPHPAHLSLWQMTARMFWNAKWNETMFVNSCAERLILNPTKHSEDEILNRIEGDLFKPSSSIDLSVSTHLQFRLCAIERHGSELHHEIIYHSCIREFSIEKTE